MFNRLSIKLANVASYLLYLAVIVEEGDCIIFTEAEISIKLELEPLHSNTNKTIRVVSTIIEPDEVGTVSYSVLPSSRSFKGTGSGSRFECPILGVNSLQNGNGLVFVKKSFPPAGNNYVTGEATGDQDCDYTVVADLLPDQNQNHKSKLSQEYAQVKSARLPLKMTLTTSKSKTIDESSTNSILMAGRKCNSTLQNEEICFDGLNKLTLQIFENNDRAILTSFGFAERSCLYDDDEKTVQYFVKGVNNTLTMKESKDNISKFNLWVGSDLDRESFPVYDFTLECTVNTKSTNETFELPGKLTIFDKNDNGPVWSTNQTINKNITNKIIYFSLDQSLSVDRRLQPDGNHIEFCFYDKDTSQVNNYQHHVWNDTKELIQISTESHDIIKNGISLSMIILKATLKRSPINPWDGYYCFLVAFNDRVTVRVKKSEISFMICLYYKSRNGRNKLKPRIPLNSSLTTTKSPKLTTLTRSTRVSVPIPKDAVSREMQVSCDSRCMNGIIGSSTVIIVVIISGLCLKLYLKHRNTSTKISVHSNMEARINESQTRSPGQVLPLQTWPIENGVVFSNEVLEGANAQCENKMQQSQKDASSQSLRSDHEIDSNWILPRSSITIKSVVGHGNFGQVCHAVYKDSKDANSKGMDVAVKLFKESKTFTPRQALMMEYDTLKDLDHPHVVKLIGVVLQKPMQSSVHDLLVLEYAELKSLKNFLEKCRMIESNQANPNRRIKDIWSKRFGEAFPTRAEHKTILALPMDEIMDFCVQIAEGMEYISSMRIVHRDLAARNILLTSDKICKITDFGLSRDVYLDDAYVKLSDETVPAKWLAPECFAVRKYTYQSDVWAFGILLWELVTKGRNPYDEEQIDSLYLYQFLFQGSRLSKPAGCPDSLYELMLQCWEFDPQQRPTFKELITALKRFSDSGTEMDEGHSEVKGEASVENDEMQETTDYPGITFAWNIGYGYDMNESINEQLLSKVVGCSTSAERHKTSAQSYSDLDPAQSNYMRNEAAEKEIGVIIVPEPENLDADVWKIENSIVNEDEQLFDEYCGLKLDQSYYNEQVGCP